MPVFTGLRARWHFENCLLMKFSHKGISINPDCPLNFWALTNQGIVGRVSTRQVGLKPDLRSNEQSGINSNPVIPAQAGIQRFY
jgi:hypothetical protein